jgi:hypothetical protein
MAPEEILTEEEMARLHRIGVVDALTDCLALAVQEQLTGPPLQSIVQQWLAQTCAETSTPASTGSRLTLPGGAPATERQAVMLRRGMREGYGACAEWAAQGLARDVLATRILRRIFTVWPRTAADYQARYDAYLEKELQHPRACYYASSRVWRTNVDNLRTRVTCAGGQDEAIGQRPLQRAVKLLHRHPERIAAARAAAAHETAGSVAAIKPPAPRIGGTLETGSSAAG